MPSVLSLSLHAQKKPYYVNILSFESMYSLLCIQPRPKRPWFSASEYKPMKKLKALFYPDVKFETLYIPHIYREIYLEKIYADVFKNKQPKSMTIVDVGANIGIVTHYMQPYSRKLYAIEPSSEHFEALAANKEFNGWNNVEIFHLALADYDGE